MEKKKRIALLTLVIFTAGIIITFFDALVTEVYNVIPEMSSPSFNDLVMYGPVWWKVNSVIQILLIAVGIVSFLVGTGIRKRSLRLHYTDILVVILTFLTISASGFGDIMAQTFLEIIRGNDPVNWIVYEWWWTTYLPLPWLLTVISGLTYPTGMTMLVGSIIGVILLVSLWTYYFKFYELKGKKPEEECFVLVK